MAAAAAVVRPTGTGPRYTHMQLTYSQHTYHVAWVALFSGHFVSAAAEVEFRVLSFQGFS
jgi:hypothetical protein